MQVTSSTLTPVVFHPVEVQIILESQFEYEALRSLMYYKGVIMKQIYAQDSERYKVLMSLFTEIEFELESKK